MPACYKCQNQNPELAKFCSSCGTDLVDNSAGATVLLVEDPTVDMEAIDIPIDASELPEGTVAMFIVRHGPKRGTRIALDNDEVTIGRNPEGDIFFDDVTVSRDHAVVRRVGVGFEVADAGSLNGTYVNQERVEKSVLNDGDEVQIGKFKLLYLALGSGR